MPLKYCSESENGTKTYGTLEALDLFAVGWSTKEGDKYVQQM